MKNMRFNIVTRVNKIKRKNFNIRLKKVFILNNKKVNKNSFRIIYMIFNIGLFLKKYFYSIIKF